MKTNGSENASSDGWMSEISGISEQSSSSVRLTATGFGKKERKEGRKKGLMLWLPPVERDGNALLRCHIRDTKENVTVRRFFVLNFLLFDPRRCLKMDEIQERKKKSKNCIHADSFSGAIFCLLCLSSWKKAKIYKRGRQQTEVRQW